MCKKKMKTNYDVLFPDKRLSVKGDLKQSQQVMLRMLKILDHLCRKYKIKYWVVCGTLIGTLRHKGFIPWDGDIDIAMLPEDMHKFDKVASKELPSDIFWQTSKTDASYNDKQMNKLRDRYSCYYQWEKANPNYKHHSGLQVDIFKFTRGKGDQIRHPYGPKYPLHYTTSEIFPLKEAVFEDMQVFIPNQAVKYVNKIYGDYSQLPPKNQRRAHEGKASVVIPCKHPASLQWPSIQATKKSQIRQNRPLEKEDCNGLGQTWLLLIILAVMIITVIVLSLALSC